VESICCVFGCLDLSSVHGCNFVPNDVVIAMRQLVASLICIKGGVEGSDVDAFI
jgi:hypothetical protein